MKFSGRLIFFVVLVFYFAFSGFCVIEEFLPSDPILFVKFSSFSKFSSDISNLVSLMFPKSFNEVFNSVKVFFVDKIGVDVTEVSNLVGLGITLNEEFGFGFNGRGQPFLILPVFSTNVDAKIANLQNTLYKLQFSSFTFHKGYIVAVGKEFEKSKVSVSFKSNYNVFISDKLLDSIVPFKVPKEFSSFYAFVNFDVITSNMIKLTINQSPIELKVTNVSVRFQNVPYTFQKDAVSVIVDVLMSPSDIITNVLSLEKVVDLGFYSILTNFQNYLGIEFSKVLNSLLGPSTFFVYGYNNPLNNKIMFVSSVSDQLSITRDLESMARSVATRIDVFKFSIFDKVFYRIPIKENYNLYLGVIFNRFIVSTDKDIMIGFIKNIANDQKDFDISDNKLINVFINTQQSLNNTVRFSFSDVHPFIRQIIPILVQSGRIRINSEISGKEMLTKLTIEY